MAANTATKEIKRISRTEFTAKVNEGYDREKMKEHFGITTKELSDLLKATGLKLKRAKRKPTVVLVDSTETTSLS